MTNPARNFLQNFSTTLLRTIFENCGANEPIRLPLRRSDPRYILSLVCRRWVDIIRSTSSFWDHILFTRPCSRLGPDPLLHQFSLCTTRSGQNLLSIAFDMVSNGWSFSIVRCVIIPHLHRIEMLSCPIYTSSDIIEFLTIDEVQFNVLKSVNIWFFNTRTNPPSSLPLGVRIQLTGLRNARCLRSVAMRLTNGLRPIDLYLPWHQITTLDFGRVAMSAQDFIVICHSTALRLEDGFFYISCSKLLYPNLTLWKHVVTMRALQTLRLKLLFPSADSRLFCLFRFPVLKYTWIQMYDNFQDWDISLYTKLLRASTKSLQLLHLTDYLPRSTTVSGAAIRRRHRETTQDSLETFFEVISNVQDLHLPLGLYIHRTILEKMAACTLLPQLCMLELGAVNAWAVLFMARQRRAHLLSVSFSPQGLSRSLEAELLKSIEDRQSLGSLIYIYMMIPHLGHGFSTEDHAALIAEAQALGLLGIWCRIEGTDILPLPVFSSDEAEARPRAVGHVLPVQDKVDLNPLFA